MFARLFSTRFRFLQTNTLPRLSARLLTPTTLILCALVLVGLLLRLYGIRFGLPYPYHFDETVYTGGALNLGAGKVGVQVNPTGLMNLLFVEYAAYFVYGKLTGLFEGAAAFGAAYHRDPSAFLLLARITSAVLGALAVLVIYWTGKLWQNRRVGLLASGFMAVAFLSVRDSHFGVPDAPVATFVSLAVLLCLLAVKHAPVKPLAVNHAFWLAAFCSALAITVKWSVWPVILPLGLAAVLNWRGLPPSGQGAFWRTHLLPGGLAFAFGGLLGGFQILLAPQVYINYAMQEAQAGKAGGFWIWQIDTLPGWLFYAKVLFQGLGLVLALLVIGGLVWVLYRSVRTRSGADWLLLAFPLAYYLIMGATRHYFARYLLPEIPFGLLFAAVLLDDAYCALEPLLRRKAWAWSLAGISAALVVLGVITPLAWDVRLGQLLSQTDTRTQAHDWITAQVPDGARIAVDWPFLGPPLSTIEDPVLGGSKVFQVQHFMDTPGLSSKPLDWYRQQGFDYLVSSSFITTIPLNDPATAQSRQAFLAELDQDLKLMADFSPSAQISQHSFVFDEIYAPLVSLWERERPGPVLKIYQVK